jgi:hypothetical protein
VLDEGGLLTVVETAREPRTQRCLLRDGFPLGLLGGNGFGLRGGGWL